VSAMRLFVNLRLLLIALLLGGPIMACAIPNAQLTFEEKQCCKDMGGDCGRGASDMPMSHSCCKAAVQPPHDFRPCSTFAFSVPSLAISVAGLPFAIPFAEPSSQFASWLSQAPSPPRGALDASAPLRI
jgi:hypothetical protein